MTLHGGISDLVEKKARRVPTAKIVRDLGSNGTLKMLKAPEHRARDSVNAKAKVELVGFAPLYGRNLLDITPGQSVNN